MTTATITGFHHLKVPVTDLARSLEWYQRVFGFEVEMEFRDDGEGPVRGVAGRIPGLGDVGFALRENPDVATGMAGYDPFAFGIADRAAAEAWVARFDELGVEHSPIIDATIGWIVSCHDPDGMEVRFYSFAPHHIDHSGRPGYGQPVEKSEPVDVTSG